MSRQARSARVLVACAAFAALCGAFLLARAPAQAQTPPALALNPSLDYAETQQADGVAVIPATELGRLLGATRFWHADVRKLELRLGPHRLVLTVDNPFVLVDDTTRFLPAPVTLEKGEMLVPAAIVDAMADTPGWPRLLHDPRRHVVLVVPPGGVVGAPSFQNGTEVARVRFPADHPAGAAVAGRARGHFRLRFDGVFSGELPDSLPGAGLVRGIRAISAVKGCAFELSIAPEAEGFRVIRDARTGLVTIEIHRRRGAGDETFAPAGPAGPRDIALIVLDPGHGGVDAGARGGGLEEKNLTLELAKMLRDELAARMPVRVLLTREDDRTLPAEQRAEFANRVRADLVISLHFDGFEGSHLAGATAYCPPATAAATAEEPTTESGWSLRPWRDVAYAHAVESRALAEALLSALELRGQGPTRLREMLPYPLVGVDAPGVMLECASLTSASDRARLKREDGLQIIASTLADGIEAYRRNE